MLVFIPILYVLAGFLCNCILCKLLACEFSFTHVVEAKATFLIVNPSSVVGVFSCLCIKRFRVDFTDPIYSLKDFV